MKCEIFEGLSALRRDSRIGPAVRGCFEWLWHLAGGRADYIVVTTKRIAFDFGVERKTVEGWLEKLQEYGLVEVVDRDKRRGTIHLYVFHPRPERREPRPDPQQRLDFGSAKRPGICDVKTPSRLGICDAKTPSRQPALGFTTPKSPAGDNITRACASDDCDDEEEISSSSSLSLSAVDLIRGAIDLRRRLFPGLQPNLRHRDKVLLASAVAIAGTHGDSGKTWLEESVEATTEHKPQKPVQYLKTCLREGVATHLGRCGLAETADEFARMLLRVRPTVERAIVEYRQMARAATAGQEGASDESGPGGVHVGQRTG